MRTDTLLFAGFGLLVLERVGELALHARWDEAKAAELVRLTRRIFRIARKVQKAQPS